MSKSKIRVRVTRNMRAPLEGVALFVLRTAGDLERFLDGIFQKLQSVTGSQKTGKVSSVVIWNKKNGTGLKN